MNCPNCHAHGSRQTPLTEGQKKCTVCSTVWIMREGSVVVLSEGQSFLSEVPGSQDIL